MRTIRTILACTLMIGVVAPLAFLLVVIHWLCEGVARFSAWLDGSPYPPFEVREFEPGGNVYDLANRDHTP